MMRKTFSLLAALLLVAPLALADDAKPAAAAPTLSLGVHERILENGLQVLTVERPGAPRATCWLFMKTGSVNERPGITGISHLFEHLMFKGTHRIGVRDYKVDQELQRQLDEVWQQIAVSTAAGDDKQKVGLLEKFKALRDAERANDIQDELWDLYLSNGGTGLNAFTGEDMTAYIVTLPANKVELFMWLEADRLGHAVFREFYAERDVVKEERRLDENSPDGPYNEQLNAAFFMAMPYHWPVLGWMSDLDAITPADCREYFDVFYAPNNAALVIVGDVKHAEVEKLAERYFKPVPRGPKPPPAIRTTEPRPCGERRVTVLKKDAKPRASLMFHCPRLGDADGPALDVAQMLLSGKSGRLHDALVEKAELCVEVKASHEERRWAGVFEVEGYARQHVAPKKVAEALQAELDRLGTDPAKPAELERAKNRLQADLLKQLDEPESLTNLIGAYAVKADWRLLEQLPARWQAVTAEDVQRVAKKYFEKEVRTLGLLEASAGADDEDEKEPGDQQDEGREKGGEPMKQGGAER